MTTNSISIKNNSLVQVRLIEARDLGYVIANDRHFALKPRSTLDITSSLQSGINVISLMVSTESIKNDPTRIMTGKNEWSGRFEIYINGDMAGAYAKKGPSFIGGKEYVVASIELNLVKDNRKPTTLQLVNRFQRVQEMLDADRADFPKSHPHIIFKNGVAINLWRNSLGVDHIFIVDGCGACVYGGYVLWPYSKKLKRVLEDIRHAFKSDIIEA